jgi:outer membrane receptor protein involved in Fe transport
MLFRSLLLVSTMLASAPALAATATADTTLPDAPGAGDKDKDGADDATAIVVTARRLDRARDSIDPSLGANKFAFSREQLDNQPGGADRNLKGVLLQAPGVAQDSDGDGDIHIRNEHGNVQYRLNGVTVPQGFAGFGALVDPRVAASIEVITGALPAQYGFRTAGVVNLKTRTDSFDFDGDVGIYGGSHGTVQPSVTLRDGIGSLNYFVSASYLRNDQGISNPTASRNAIHDRTEQYRGFGYVSDVVDDNSRVTAFGGASYGTFQIPNTPGLVPRYRLNGRTAFDSSLLDQNQKQNSQFAVLAYQYSGDKLDFQFAPFVRNASAHYTPDPRGGQLLFNGVETELTQASLAWGVQSDAGLKLGDRHHLRAGLFYQRERTTTDSINRVFAVDLAGNQTSDVPIVIPVAQRQRGTTFAAYLQDEWQPSDALTFNFGMRYDRSDALVGEDQISPRFGMVWKPGKWTTFHAGYARYFTPPPIELVAANSLAAFAGTTGASAVTVADPVRAEREHNFDVGLQQFLTPRLSIEFDAYYKRKTNLLDEEHFGSTLIQSPFNYARSNGWGVEAGFNYEAPKLEIYGNLARGDQKARAIVSNQFFFDQPELDYIASHYIYTDHSQKWTGSAGGALKLHDGLGKLTPSFDLIYGSGLRAADPDPVRGIPNGGTQQPYVQVNVGISQAIGHDDEESWTLRLDVVNLFDKVYLIHDGSGVGAGQPEYGPRRGFFVGLRKSF